MEDILAIAFVLVTVFVVYQLAVVLHKRHLASKERDRLAREAEAEYILEQSRRQRELRKKIRQEQTLAAVANTKAVPPKSPSFVPSPTQSVNNYQDDTLSDVLLGVALNQVINSVSHSPSVKSSESSWGFDDSDSRKSASSSFSSSDSSSSWSSSSDSGPSSDW